LKDAGRELDHGVELLLLDQPSAAASCAPSLEPKRTPSGTMTAARPPGFSRRRKSARKRSSVFLVLTIA
jgi:hypothetical protein